MTKEKNSLDPIGTNAEIIRFIKSQWNTIFDWLKTNPGDSILIRIGKAIGKVFAVLAFILLSPVVAITLVVAFLIAF